MDGLLNPVGPESTRTYWVRRGLVLVGLLLVVALVAALVKAFFASGTGPKQAVPAGVTTSSTTQNASDSAASKPAAPNPAAPNPATSESSSPDKPKPTPSVNPKPTPSATPTPTPTVGLCQAGKVKVAVTGPTSVTLGTTTSLSVGVTNASAATCLFDPRAAGFELRVYSGNDRIWSTLDCPTGVPQKPVALAAAKAQVWEFSWPTKRSAAGCKLTNNLRPGTYVATVVADQAEPAQHVMHLKAA